ncbi:hypothetical protein Mhun_2123 [Methanospirillum hungatei JF-1]|uniref:Uncharacterized protein n=1 Tax=Methanospirillum hungatei JF-1 (strain ATCC 27890 / DSM 864 / NBRC 100397 / JF-1) TaxID=323259 RepID=Q2FN98_METHJ|nr:hypothetical protein [Methanospirillum hungatei]ABD41830.1 hypothetical protein Mhun_2123 [Methanospirillum hungatei JF-1]
MSNKICDKTLNENICHHKSTCKREYSIAILINPLEISHIEFNYQFAVSLVNTIIAGSKSSHDLVKVILGIQEEINSEINPFLKDLDPECIIREFWWEYVNNDNIERIRYLEGIKKSTFAGNYYIPRDGMADFFDTSWWIIISNNLYFNLAALRKTSYLVPNPIEYIGTNGSLKDSLIFHHSNEISNYLTFFPFLKEYFVSKYLIPENKIHLLPLFRYLPENKIPFENEKALNYYLVWQIDIGSMDLFIENIEYFIDYFSDGNYELTIIFTKNGTPFQINYYSDPDLLKLKKILGSKFTKKQQIKFSLMPSRKDYYFMLKNAQFIFIPFIDNYISDYLLDISIMGKQVLCIEHPILHYLCKQYSIDANFFNNANELNYYLSCIKRGEKSLEFGDCDFIKNKHNNYKNHIQFWQELKKYYEK